MSLNKLSFLYILVIKIKLLEQLRFLKSDMQGVFPMGALVSSSKNITLREGPLAVILKNKTIQKMMMIMAILASQGCCNKVPLTGCLKTKEMYCLIVLEAGSSKSKCLQGHALSQDSRKEFPLIPAPLSLPISLPFLLAFSRFLFSLNLFGLSGV